VVDFLFSLLSLPIGTFVKILEEDSSIVGCVGCLYDSSENLKGTYVQLGDAILHPAALSPARELLLRCSGGAVWVEWH
jgi:hypothetical protein